MRCQPMMLWLPREKRKPQLSTCLRKNRTPIWWRAFNPLETWQFFQNWKKLDHLFRQGWKFSKCLKPTPIYQPMINWWYGARWFGFLGSPYEWDCDLGVSRCESQTTNLPLSWVYFLSEKKMKIKFLLGNSSLVGGWTNPLKKKVRQFGSFSPGFRGKKKKMFETTPPVLAMGVFLIFFCFPHLWSWVFTHLLHPHGDAIQQNQQDCYTL